MNKDTITVGDDGFLRDKNGTLMARPVNNVLTQLVSLEREDMLILRLYQATEHKHGRTSATSDSIPPESAHQFVLPVQTAERLAEMLDEALRAAHGRGKTRQ